MLIILQIAYIDQCSIPRRQQHRHLTQDSNATEYFLSSPLEPSHHANNWTLGVADVAVLLLENDEYYWELRIGPLDYCYHCLKK